MLLLHHIAKKSLCCESSIVFCGAYSPEPIDIPFGVLSGLPHVIISVKSCRSVNGFLPSSTTKSAISYTLSNVPYNRVDGD